MAVSLPCEYYVIPYAGERSMTRDQKQLTSILEAAEDARDAAYSLFSRRLDTQRNLESFILLHDAYISLERACDLLMVAVEKATEKKSSDQNSVALEIMVRTGMATIVSEGTRGAEDVSKGTAPKKPKTSGKVLPFERRRGKD